MAKTKRPQDKLTPRDVNNAKAGWLGDGGGLWLRTDADGSRQRWIFRSTTHGRTTEIGLGGSDKVSLALARRKRDQILDQLANGLDPKQEKRKAADAIRNRKTFAETAQAVIKARQSGWRTSTEGRTSSLDEWTQSLIADCQTIAGKFVDELDLNDIKRVVSPYWDAGRHASARRLLNRIELAIEYALAHGWRTADNPAAWKRFQHLAPSQPKNGDKAHFAAMPWREVPEFVRRLRKVEGMSALALTFAILTATRSSEARGARWSEIDFDTATWTIPAERMKGKRLHAVPLSAPAVRLLRQLETIRADAFIFPGEGKGTCVSNKTMWEATKSLAPNATSHGFRSSFRDFCSDHGVEREVAELCLAHRIGSAVEQAYNRTSLLERRRPVIDDWGRFIDGESTERAKVVSIANGRKR
jgi:integrase